MNDPLELTPLSPTGEIHRDPIEGAPWKLAQWAEELGIPEQQVRQLATEVGPVFEDIKRRWDEQVAERLAADEIKKEERSGF